MNNELSKTISTCAVWLALACILTFGIFKMSVNGDMAVFFIFFCLPLGMIVFAVKATTVIWRGGQQEQKPVASAATVVVKT